jgi:hypothetical protein
MKHTRKVHIAVAAAAAALVLTGVGETVANATSTSGSHYQYTYQAFKQTIDPVHELQIPSLSCPTGYLVNERLSEGRIVPKGVQVVEPGGIGVTINHVTSEKVDVGGKTLHLATGTDAERLYSQATNWDPFSSHELVINLACTTDPNAAATDPQYDSNSNT